MIRTAETGVLTPRERGVMVEIVAGLNSREIGAHLGINPRTVDVYRAAAVQKLGANNSAHAAVIFDRADRV